MKKPEYQEYLKSVEWSVRRQWAIDLAGGRCLVCNSGERLHVHHRTYQRIGRELPGDVTVLCSDCHARFHDKIEGPERPSLSYSERTIETYKRMRDGGLWTAAEVGVFDQVEIGESWDAVLVRWIGSDEPPADFPALVIRLMDFASFEVGSIVRFRVFGKDGEALRPPEEAV